jgi:thioredoxin 1
MARLLHITDENFKIEVLDSQMPVLVDFFATWCAPCRAISPVLEELAEAYVGKIKIGKIDIDESPNIPSQYGIMSVPTLIFFKGGQACEQLVGAVPKHHLEKKIRDYITEDTTYGVQ